jgi:hypothetical protein
MDHILIPVYATVEEDVRKLGCGNWWMAARNRDGWRRIKEAAKVHYGL